MRQVPLASGAEVVIDRDELGLGLRDEPVDEVAADESGPTDEEVATSLAQRSDSQWVPWR